MTDVAVVRKALDLVRRYMDDDEDAWVDYDTAWDALKRATAALPLIEAAALERAAKVAETVDIEDSSIIAAHIRALKEQP